MGSGSWTASEYKSSVLRKGYASVDDFKTKSTLQSTYKERNLHEQMDPYRVIRECKDTDEHPETVPVILALDVTGSMGSTCHTIARQLGDIMGNVFDAVKDVEFMIMAIGDLDYDRAPIQASQFESDIRISNHLDKVYFEGRGGGNAFESYTAAWYFGLHNTDLDCWKRGKKGLIITIGDEPMNPYLSASKLGDVLGHCLQADVETPQLYKEVCEKFDVYHIAVDDRGCSYERYTSQIKNSWGKLLGQNLVVSRLNDLDKTISDIVVAHASKTSERIIPFAETESATEPEYISW